MRSHHLLFFLVFLGGLCVLTLESCGTTRNTAVQTGTGRSFMVLSINDVYRIDGVYEGKQGGLARVRTLREELEKQYPDLIFLHAGDFLFPSLLSGTYNGRQMISVLNLMDGRKGFYDDHAFTVFGNHEFEKARMKDTALLEELISSSEFGWFGTNIDFVKNEHCNSLVESDNLLQSTIVTSNGIKVGLFGLSTDVKHPAYVQTFRDPIATAKQMTASLRKRGAEVVIALTHLSASEDKHILETLGADGPDIIFGGHEHEQQSHVVNGRYILKANADATSAVVAKVTLNKNSIPDVNFEMKELGQSTEQDVAVLDEINSWFGKYDSDYCKDNNLPEGCTTEKYSFAAVDLIAEEIQIRKYETNLGNWVADQMRNALASEGAQIAFINSGSIRLNQNIQKGDDILRKHINEMFPYQNNLKLIEITGADLQKIVNHAVSDWAGNGWWLQISGFAFTHDPQNEKAGNLTLLTPNGPREILPSDKILAVTSDYLLDTKGDQDGFTMLRPEMIFQSASSPVLTDVILDALKKNYNSGIAPQVEGRICNLQKPGSCLALTK